MTNALQVLAKLVESACYWPQVKRCDESVMVGMCAWRLMRNTKECLCGFAPTLGNNLTALLVQLALDNGSIPLEHQFVAK